MDGTYSVRQEVNTADPGLPEDIADIVLENHETAFVIENYYASDGHGHSYAGYGNFGAREHERSVVVMLCEIENRGALTDGWQDAQVVTYASLLQRLSRHVANDAEYQKAHTEQCVFFEHMQRRFVKGRYVNDANLVDFIEAMCRTGEADRYGWQKQQDAAISFGDRLREEAIQQFTDSRDVLARIKQRLRDYAVCSLVPQVNARLGTDWLGEVYINYSGSYRWTVGFTGPDDPQKVVLQIKFGPSAWYANEGDRSLEDWQTRVPPAEADYSLFFLTRIQDKSIRQSAVALRDFLETPAPDDVRLRDEIVGMIQELK
jgi:hypothetical protein